MPDADILAHMVEAAAAYDKALRATSKHRQIADAAHAEALKQLADWRAWQQQPDSEDKPWMPYVRPVHRAIPRPRQAPDNEKSRTPPAID